MEQKFDFSQADPLFVEVAKYVVETGKAQASALQRDFELGYNRASRIISQLEAAGIVGEAVHCKPRAVLCTAEELEQKLAKWQINYLREKIQSSADPMAVLNEIHKTIATKTSEIDDIQDEIEKMEDKISALEYEISDLQTLTDEALIHITKIWCENLKQEFPQFGATILEDNTIIRLQIPVKGENIYALLELNNRKYKLTSCDGNHNRDMYFLLKDIIPEPTPQQSTYGYGYVDFEKAYEVFSELIRKLEKL